MSISLTIKIRKYFKKVSRPFERAAYIIANKKKKKIIYSFMSKKDYDSEKKKKRIPIT